MRTTIEINNKLRAELLKEAAKRGEKGFSHIVEDAIEQYFGDQEQYRENLRKALRLKGSIPAEEAGRLRNHVRRVRSHWR